MEFHFVNLGRTNLATITDPKHIPRAICFRDRINAVKYVDYISTYRCKFGYWPSIDLSEPMTQDYSKGRCKKTYT